MSAPLRIDASTLLDDSTDFHSLVQRRLAGETTFTRDDITPLEPFERLFQAVKGSPYADRISRAAAECLTDDNPLVRGMAAMFFQQHPDAAGAERIGDVVGTHRQLYAGVARPWDPSSTLERELLRALAARVRAGDAAARAAAFAEVLVPGNGLPLVGTLAEVDPTWVTHHAEEIVRASPNAGAALLNGLQQRDVDLGSVGARIAAIAAAGDSKFAEHVSQWIEDDAAKAKILDAIRR